MANIFKALNESTAGDGGYAVPEEFAARVLDLVQAQTVTLPDLETVRMNTDTWRLPKVTSGSTAYVVSELGTITASQLGLGQITLTPKKFAALIEASTEVLEDNNVGMQEVLTRQMAKDIGLKIDNEVLNGTTGGSGFVGLRDTASFTNSVSAAGAIGSTTAAAIGLTAISLAVDEVLKDNHEQPDVSYFNPRTVGSLRKLTDGSARPIFNQETWGSPLLKTGVVGTIYGFSVKPASQLPINISHGTGAAATTADAIIGKSGLFGYYGLRRDIIMRRDYVIETDREQFQMTLRSAFAIKYANSYCLIRGITD